VKKGKMNWELGREGEQVMRKVGEGSRGQARKG